MGALFSDSDANGAKANRMWYRDCDKCKSFSASNRRYLRAIPLLRGLIAHSFAISKFSLGQYSFRNVSFVGYRVVFVSQEVE